MAWFDGAQFAKKWQTGPQKVRGPICHLISEGPNLPRATVINNLLMSWYLYLYSYLYLYFYLYLYLSTDCMAGVLNSSYRSLDEWLKADQTKPATSVSTMHSGCWSWWSSWWSWWRTREAGRQVDILVVNCPSTQGSLFSAKIELFIKADFGILSFFIRMRF